MLMALNMTTIEISQDVWNAIAAEGKFGDTHDSVLRRKYCLPEGTPNVAPRGQNAATGRRGNERGRSETARAADVLGIEKVPDARGNEYVYKGEQVALKWAKYGNGRIGITKDMSDRVDAVIGVLENSAGRRELWYIDLDILLPHGEPAVKNKKLLMYSTRLLLTEGTLITTYDQ